MTLPSPSLFANFWDPESLDGRLPEPGGASSPTSPRSCARRPTSWRALGARYLQLDAPHYPLLVDPTWRDFYESRGWPAERWLELGLELDHYVIGAPPGRDLGFHLCRGNQASRWLVSGGYEWLAERIFPTLHVERLLLEYDDERSGGFDPLARVPEQTVCVLGLVTTKSGRRETVDELARTDPRGRAVRAARAAGAVPAMRLRHVRRRQRPHDGR